VTYSSRTLGNDNIGILYPERVPQSGELVRTVIRCPNRQLKSICTSFFSTKDRAGYFEDQSFRRDLHKYLAGPCQKLDCPAIIVGGGDDHVHIACRLGRCIEVNILLRELKRESSKWIKIEAPKLDDFSWQGGYGVFSVSPSHLELLIEYIRNQEEHHRKETYQDEFRRLCRLYGVELDERYVWD
jgi:putative transposase